MKLISGQKLLFADKIKKTNMFEWTQERTLVITNQAVFNIHKKEIKRQIQIKSISGLTKTVPPSKSLEFSIHVDADYDYRFSSQRREEIMDLIKRLYLIERAANCPIYHTTTKDLKEFTTTEKDFKKKISRVPTSEYRNYDEDLFKNMKQPELVKQVSTTNDDNMNNL